MPHLLLPTLLLLLTDQGAGAGSDAPREAWVVADALTVLTEPDDGSYATGTLARGARVVVLREDPVGWAAIAPPEHAFSWVERSAVEDLGQGMGRLRAPAAVRPGGERAALPAGTWTVLQKGEVVRLLDRRPLVVRGADGARQVWLAVRPPAGEVRYVHAEGLADWDPSGMPEEEGGAAPPKGGGDPFRFLDDASNAGRARRSLASQRVGTIDPGFATVGPPASRIGLSPAFADALDRAEAAHRAVLVLPLEAWRLDGVAESYQALRATAATPEERAIVQSRLDQVARQQAVGAAARRIAALADRSRRRDGELAAIHEGLGRLALEAEGPFDVVGLLHRSSILLGGRRSFAVIDADGGIAAYLEVPPGLDAERLVARQVGVRGDVRFDETLRERVVWVRTLEALDDAP
jgi:hypothetical protein